MQKGEPSQLLVGISANGYPVSDNITLNCEGVIPSHIKEGETEVGYPLRTYTMYCCDRNSQLLKCKLQIIILMGKTNYYYQLM